jgi:hypothetical protein
MKGKLQPTARTPIPVHIDRRDSGRADPATATYSVSFGGSKDGVGTVLIAKPRSLAGLAAVLHGLGVARAEIELACRVLTEQPHHEILVVTLARTYLRKFRP